MGTAKNRGRYDRSKLRYPSDLANYGITVTPYYFPDLSDLSAPARAGRGAGRDQIVDVDGRTLLDRQRADRHPHASVARRPPPLRAAAAKKAARTHARRK